MAIGRSADKAIARKEPTILRASRVGVDAAALAAAEREDDAVAVRILAQTSEHLGRGISFLPNVLNPEMIVLGGSMAAAGEALLREVRGAVARHALLPHGVTILPSALATRLSRQAPCCWPGSARSTRSAS